MRKVVEMETEEKSEERQPSKPKKAKKKRRKHWNEMSIGDRELYAAVLLAVCVPELYGRFSPGERVGLVLRVAKFRLEELDRAGYSAIKKEIERRTHRDGLEILFTVHNTKSRPW